MRNMTDRITPTRFHESDGVEDWRVVGEGACAYFRTGSFAAGAGLQLTVDAHDIPKVKPFWRAVLGYQDRADSPEDVVDPHSRGTPIWFQKLDAPDPLMHIDVWVPPEEGEARVAAAIAAGGHLVTDKYAPSWWTLSDPEGNLVDVCTTRGRD